MKTTKSVKHNTPSVIYDSSLDKYEQTTLFPEKLALAKEQLQKAPIPESILKLAGRKRS